jgi:hypothetical protein
MLPHFPKAHEQMTEVRNAQMFNGMYSVSPILSQIAVRAQREGRASSFQDEQGAIKQIDYKKISVSIQRKLEDARGLTPDEFIEAAREPGIGMGKEMMRGVWGMLDKVTQETGNVVNGPLNHDLFLDLVEKVQFDFDRDGTPQWPSLHLGLEAYAKFQHKFPEWLKDPQFQTRLNRIMERKREEFYERETCRRLVD